MLKMINVVGGKVMKKINIKRIISTILILSLTVSLSSNALPDSLDKFLENSNNLLNFMVWEKYTEELEYLYYIRENLYLLSDELLNFIDFNLKNDEIVKAKIDLILKNKQSLSSKYYERSCYYFENKKALDCEVFSQYFSSLCIKENVEHVLCEIRNGKAGLHEIVIFKSGDSLKVAALENFYGMEKGSYVSLEEYIDNKKTDSNPQVCIDFNTNVVLIAPNNFFINYQIPGRLCTSEVINVCFLKILSLINSQRGEQVDYYFKGWSNTPIAKFFDEDFKISKCFKINFI